MKLSTFASISLAASLQLGPVNSQHIRPSGNEGVISFVDISGLGEGKAFYENDSLLIQLVDGGPTYELLREEGSILDNTAFYGVSRDGKVDSSLLRFVDEETGASILTGFVQDADAAMWYKIRPDAFGHTTVTAVPFHAKRPSHGEPREASDGLWRSFVGIIGSKWATFSTDVSAPVSGTSDESFFDKAVADIMVIWTEDAECLASFQFFTCTLSSTTKSNMQAQVELAISNANLAYKKSNIDLKLNLVHSARDGTGYYTRDEDKALDDVTNSLNELSYIGSLRYNKGADIVSLVMYSEAVCGLGWVGNVILPSLQTANDYFNIVSYDCLDDYTLAHEIGHNLVRLHSAFIHLYDILYFKFPNIYDWAYS